MSGDDGPARRGARAAGRRTEHFYGLEKEAKSQTAYFFIEGVDLCVVNSARRAVSSDVPNVAVEFDPMNPVRYDINNITMSGVMFKKNTSVIDNEKLGRLISMIPICVDENRLQGYDPNTYKFILKVKNNGDQLLTVKSKDIRVLDSTDAEVPLAVRDALFPPCPITGDHIVIVRLKPSPLMTQDGEEIDVEFRARLGTGKENACWSPTCKCAFGFVKNDELFSSNFRAFLEKIKLEMDQGRVFTREEIDLAKSQYATLEGQRDYVQDKYDNPVAIKFTIETVNRLSPTYLFFEGLRILIQKMKDLKDEIVKVAVPTAEDDSGWEAQAQQQRVSIEQQSNMDDMFQITVRYEGHTLGNLVQGLLYRHWNLKGVDSVPQGAEFFGYTEPHPHEGRIVFNIKVNAGDKVGKVMEDGLDWCIGYVNDIALEFAEFANLEGIAVVKEEMKMMMRRKGSKLV